MYIEFELPQGAGGTAAAHKRFLIRQAVNKWATKHDVAYTEKTVKYTHRICFTDDAICDFFALSYTGTGKFRIVDPLNNLT